MKVLVLGAGVIGVTSAWYLAKDGHDVTVLDRQPTAGLETSFANGGQISVSHAEPWANPGAPAKIFKWLGREDAPLLFRLRADPRQWTWGLRFLFECLPQRTRRNTLIILRLGLYSRDLLKSLRGETGVQYDHLEKGILQIHTDAGEFEAAHARIELLRSHGCEMHIKSVQECMDLEPALRATRIGLIGGTYAPDDESGDAHQFTGSLAELCRERGVQFGYEHAIESLNIEGDAVIGAVVRDPEGRRELVKADAFLVALGSYSPLLLSPAGIRVPVYPVKGYSVTVPLTHPEAAPTLCLSDENAGIDRLRYRAERCALQRDPVADRAVVPGRRGLCGRIAMGGVAPNDPEQCAAHRAHPLPQPVPQYRPRHARLDACLWVGTGGRRPDRRAQARCRIPFSLKG